LFVVNKQELPAFQQTLMNNQRTQSARRSLQRIAFVLTAGLTLFLAGCKKNNDLVAPVAANNANGGIDNWILDNMREYYYWNDKIPASPDTTLAPDKFFDTLLNKFNATTNPQGDRFSWIDLSASNLKAELSGSSLTTGADFDLYLRAANSPGIIAQVLYVLPNSPAHQAGLKRGDIITKVNGTVLDTLNYNKLLFGNATTFTYGLASTATGDIVDTDASKTVTATTYQENPILLDSVYSVGSKKVGYLVYNQFVPGANGSSASEYDAQVDAIFNKFKAQGINEMVLDLRYNPGGYTSSSANLASLIGTGVNSGKLYFREEWNPTITPIIQKDPQGGDAFFKQNFLDKSQNVGNSLNRVFVITTGHTASASELIINGLRPYMPVITIGTTSVGKNVGSITITDNTGKYQAGLQPIVFRSYNSLNQSDYWTGFKPTVMVEEPLNLLPFGDTREALLSAALAQISGTGTGGRMGAANANPLKQFGSSISHKAGGHFGMLKVLKNPPAIMKATPSRLISKR